MYIKTEAVLVESNLLVSLITVTEVASECINAFVSTLMNLNLRTFIYVTMQRLIRFI